MSHDYRCSDCRRAAFNLDGRGRCLWCRGVRLELRDFARLVRDTAARPHLVAAARAIVGDDES